MLQPDFADLLNCLNDHGVEYLVVGGYAVIAHGYVRSTKDLDIWVADGADNARRLHEALLAFAGAAPEPGELLKPRMLVRMGRPPGQVEIMTHISGVQFERCAARAVGVQIDGVRFRVLGLADLRANKLASGRPQDLADLDNLPTPELP